MAKFYAHEIELGQVNILMAALVVAAVAQMRAGREMAAGLLVAVAVVVKPYAVLLMPYLAARRRFGSLAGAGIGLGIALLLPIVAYGFSGNLTLLGEWWRTVTETTAPNLMDFNNVSAASVFARWLGPGPDRLDARRRARPDPARRRGSGVPDARRGSPCRSRSRSACC